MKSRLAILATLVAGLFMSGTGATLAIDGLQTKQDAAIEQYGNGSKGEVLGDTGSGGNAGDIIPPPAQPGGEEASAPRGDQLAQPTRQVEVGAATPGELPFTGYAGITVLLLGLALLTSGLVLRKRTREQL